MQRLRTPGVKRKGTAIVPFRQFQAPRPVMGEALLEEFPDAWMKSKLLGHELASPATILFVSSVHACP